LAGTVADRDLVVLRFLRSLVSREASFLAKLLGLDSDGTEMLAEPAVEGRRLSGGAIFAGRNRDSDDGAACGAALEASIMCLKNR
jgi:hypothetical protein